MRLAEADGVSEVLAEGTISARSTFTLTGPVPSKIKKITALRIDVLPKDLGRAERIPEMGFVLSHFELFIRSESDGDFREVALQEVLSDTDDPSIDSQQSLDDDDWGWAAYTKLYRPCHAVFVPAEPFEASPTTKIKLVLRQQAVDSGENGLVIQRSRYSTSEDSEWHRIAASDAFLSKRRDLTDLCKRRDSIASVDVPVMAEQSAGECRKTFVFSRGNWLDRGAAVAADVPAAFPPLPSDAPRNRLGLARWLVTKENPLTARVMVNRLWEQLFGRGIVATLEDFGSSGAEPTHPELLDYLAVRFRDHYRWSIKRMLREIVLSSVYRQSAAASPDQLQRDPQNFLLARGPRTRLSAEMVRDSALACSGLLSKKMYGPPVMPPQPEGIWSSAYSDAKWVTSDGEDRYRRAIYTYWKRTSGYPSFIMFDAPSREICTARRVVTNTPLQALVTLNDPVYFKCAQAMAKRMDLEATGALSDRIAWAYGIATGRRPTRKSVESLTVLYGVALESVEEHSSNGNSTSHADGNLTSDRQLMRFDRNARLFALSIVANAILNLDEALTK
jgi:hypothetical protein